MPVAEWDTKYRRESTYDFPKLFLEKDERARIIVLQTQPRYEWVHNMTFPKMSGGEVVMRTFSRDDGTKVQVPDNEWIGRHICLGSVDLIEEKGIDPTNCPVCEESRASDAVRPPERRFGMLILRYATEPGTFDVASPFSVNALGWSFPNKIFDKFLEIKSDLEDGDIRLHDILLGPCESKNWQRFDIKASNRKAEWLADKERQSRVKETWKQNENRDITSLIGRRLTREQVEDQLQTVLERYKIAFGRRAEEPEEAEEASAPADVDLDGIMSDEPSGDGAADPRAETEDKPEEEKQSGGGVIDFDSILDS